MLFGVPLALVLARRRGRRFGRCAPLILLPLVLPPVVGGLALLYAFGRLGLLGQYLEAAGIRIAFTTTAVVLAQTFVSLPFLVIALEGAARTAGAGYDAVAATLGARPATVWWRVTLPLLGPGLVSGAVLAFARALGEFGATLTFAGSRQGVTRTLPLEIYLQRESRPAGRGGAVDAADRGGRGRGARAGSRRLAGWTAGGELTDGRIWRLSARPGRPAASMSPSRWPPVRCLRCWAPTAPANPPRRLWSPDCCGRRGGGAGRGPDTHRHRRGSAACRSATAGWGCCCRTRCCSRI